MENKKLLIGAGVVIAGYLLWKKSQNKVNTKQYSKECLEGLERALQRDNEKPANFSRNFLENCEKSKNEIKKDSLGQPKVKIGENALPVVELDWSILSKIPNEFTVKSDGFNTRYYKNIDKTLTGFASTFSVPDVYMQPYSTTGFSGVMPTKISVREFSDAYSKFLKQPK